jgi:hypothetical protein
MVDKTGGSGYGGTPEKGFDIPAAANARRTAPTIFGRDVHLPPHVDEGAQQAVDEAVDEGGAKGADELRDDDSASTEDMAPARGAAPAHSGKSRLPALARVFGRWNSLGDFVDAASGAWRRPGAAAGTVDSHDGDPLDNDSLIVPRDSLGRRIAIGMGVSILALAAVVGLTRLRSGTDPVGTSAQGNEGTATKPCCEPRRVLPIAAPAPSTPLPAPIIPAEPAAAAPPQPAAPTAAPQDAPATGGPRTAREGSEPRVKKARRAERRRQGARRLVPPPHDIDGPLPLSL